jgi:hypothetical protein
MKATIYGLPWTKGVYDDSQKGSMAAAGGQELETECLGCQGDPFLLVSETCTEELDLGCQHFESCGGAKMWGDTRKLELFHQ